MSVHAYTTEIEFGGDEPTACFEVTLSYTFQPASGGYVGSHTIDPPEGPTIEDIEVLAIDGKCRPWGWMGRTDDEVEDLILNHIDGKLDDAMIDEAMTDIFDERERAAEARYESRRDSDDIEAVLAARTLEVQP